MSSKKKVEANRRNARLSTGPKTQAGKRNVRLNAQKHGLYAQEIVLRPENEAEINQLRKHLDAELKPTSALQQIAFKTILQCYLRFHLSSSFDIRVLNAAVFPPEQQESSSKNDDRPVMEAWFGQSPEALRNGIRFLDRLKDEVREHGEVPEELKDSVRKGFGPDFTDLLQQPKSPISQDALLFADHLLRHEKTFGKPLPHRRAEGPEVIVDPQQSLRATLNLIELKRGFLEDLRQIQRQAGQENARVNASDSPPRHFTDAFRGGVVPRPPG
jgi:hypothetical protein